MRTIPTYIFDRKNIPKSEQKAFELLQEIDLEHDALALHSHNLVGDKKKLWYEIDFVILTRVGVLIIEVKGGRVARTADGVWTHSDPITGETIYKKNVSPLHQATLNCRAFLNNTIKAVFGESSGLKAFPCVVLAGNHKTGWSSPQLPDDFTDLNTLYREDFNKVGLRVFLEKALKQIDSQVVLTESQFGELVSHFRKELDVGVARVSDLEVEMSSLTTEQYDVADIIMPLERVVIEGGAGTGKTFLALYIARHWSASGSCKVAYVTSSLASANNLKRSNEHGGLGDFEILSLNDVIKAVDEKREFDRLVIDEGQQFCTIDWIYRFSSILRGGLDAGWWRWFGDPQNQIVDPILFDAETYDLLVTSTGNNAALKLKRNVRNTPHIIKFIERHTSAGVGQAEVTGFGPTIECLDENQIYTSLLKFFSDEGSEILSDLGPQLSFLCRDVEDFAIADRYAEKLGVSLDNYDGCEDVSRKVIVSTIDDFRGLEAQLIVVLGLNVEQDSDELRRLIYQSVSRSRAYVFIEGDDLFLRRIYGLRRNN